MQVFQHLQMLIFFPSYILEQFEQSKRLLSHILHYWSLSHHHVTFSCIFFLTRAHLNETSPNWLFPSYLIPLKWNRFKGQCTPQDVQTGLLINSFYCLWLSCCLSCLDQCQPGKPLLCPVFKGPYTALRK